MADFVKTISNNLNLFGPDRPNFWGSAVLGQDNWGYGNNDLITVTYKVIGEVLSLADTLAISIGYIRTFTASLTLTAYMTDERLLDAAGYAYVFGTSANAENRPLTGYNRSTDITTTFTTLTNTTTTWTRQ